MCNTRDRLLVPLDTCRPGLQGTRSRGLTQEAGSVGGSYREHLLCFPGLHNLEFSNQAGHLAQYDNIQQIMPG